MSTLLTTTPTSSLTPSTSLSSMLILAVLLAWAGGAQATAGSVAREHSPPSVDAAGRLQIAQAEPIKVLVLAPTGDVPVGVKSATQTTLVTEIAGLERFDAVSTQELAAVMGVEAEKQALGCDASSCLMEVAAALDADVVLIAQVSGLAETFLISVSAFSTQTTSVVSAVQLRANKDVEVPFAVVDGLEGLLSPLLSINERTALAAELEASRQRVRDRDAGASGLKTAIEEAAREAASSAVKETAETSGAEAGAEAAEALLAKALKERAEVRFGPQSGPKVYIADPTFSGVESTLAKGLMNGMSEAAQSEGLSVMTAEDIRDLLSRLSNQSALGVDDHIDEKSFAALGEAIGVRHLVAVTLTQDQDDTVVQARLINAELSEVVNRREVRASRWGGSVLEAARVAIRVVLAPVFSGLQGKVTLEVTEEGATVSVDDDDIGVTPLQQPLSIPGGTHIVSVSKDGFIRHQETVKITAGTELTRKVLLRPSPDFVAAHKAKAYTFVGLTSALGVLSVPLLAGAAAGAGGWFYVGWVAIPGVNKKYEDEDLREEVPDPMTGELGPNGTLADYRAELQLLQTASIVSSAAGFALLAVGAMAGLGALGSAFFIEDPWRYDDVVAGADAADVE